MSRDTDRDLSDDLNGPYVQAACVDCGADVVVDYNPDGALCDACCEQRETWALTTERRMAKADLVARQYTKKDINGPAVVDVALVPILQPAGYLPWLDSLRANAHWGSDALARAWYVSEPQYIQHLITVAPDLWTTLQAIASRRVA